MKLSIRPVLRLSRLFSILSLGFSLLSLSGCAGFDMSKVDFSGMQQSSMFNDSTPTRQQAQQYDCQSTPRYDAWGNFMRTDTVCR